MIIELYHQMIRHFENDDPTTRILIEKLLKDEEEHASDLTDLLYIVNPETGKTQGQDPGTDALKMTAAKQPSQDGGKSATLQTTRQSGRGQKQPEDHSKERNRILNELRRMGEKKKPAA